MRAVVIFGVLIVLGAAAYAAETITFTYDARGRLKTVARTGTPPVNNNVTTNYTYDKADNRTVKTTTGSANPPPP